MPWLDSRVILKLKLKADEYTRGSRQVQDKVQLTCS
jgi:hypothetical protein